MPFHYESPGANELRQGEILGAVVDLRTANTADAVAGQEPVVDKRPHERVLVITADCDLLKDYVNRERGAVGNSAHLVEHVLVCDMYTLEELAGVTPATFGRKEMARIQANQDERYHRFPEAVVVGVGSRLTEMYLDFKRAFGLPPEAIYEQIRRGQIARMARLPDVFLQDLTHRLFGFLSRVGPDFD